MVRQHRKSPPQPRVVDIGDEGTNYLCVFLPLGTQDGDIPGAGLYGSSA